VTTVVTEPDVWEALAEVEDPEIPTVSVVDLGIVRRVEVGEDRLRVELLPTFVGCPATELIRRAVAERLAPLAPVVEVEATFAEPWTSDRITPEGRRKLLESGFAPPAAAGAPGAHAGPAGPAGGGPPLLTISARTTPRTTATCPYCGSSDTSIENSFGPTPCRSIFYCNGCKQPFEQFKSV
jgi:ring-1,2-phenylacetyl-CoA epoxidase subunit PaaD